MSCFQKVVNDQVQIYEDQDKFFLEENDNVEERDGVELMSV